MFHRPSAIMGSMLLSQGLAAPQASQVHLGLTGNATEMFVSFSTEFNCTGIVHYGLSAGKYDRNASATSTQYHFPPLYKSPFLHTAKLVALEPNAEIHYQVMDGEDLSFRTPPSVFGQVPLKIAVLGDNGHVNTSQIVLDAIAKEHESDPFGMILIAGDLSYADGKNELWDQWFNMISPLASSMPLQAAVGNHEIFDLFEAFDKRLALPPNSPQGHQYYSFDYDGAHFVAMNAETVELFHFNAQYKWLEADLQKVDRAKTPWIIGFWHTPWYSSNTAHDDSGWLMKPEFEALFKKYKVDLVINGHVHAYERTLPVFSNKTDPDAPMFILSGNGGNHEGLYTHWRQPAPEWSAYRSAFFGFGEIEIFNASHLHWTERRANDSVIADSYWLIRDR